MAEKYWNRTIEAILLKAVNEFPAVMLTGPRQSGKTTTLRYLFAKTHTYCSLDEPDIRELAISDPNLFLNTYSCPIMIDEIQYAPELLHYIKRDVDRHRSEPGRYIMTGSQHFPLMQGVTESLAGRTAVLNLLSMAGCERKKRPLSDSVPLTFTGLRRGKRSSTQLFSEIIRGGFPELVVRPRRDSRLWHAAYVQTYLERDVRSLRQIGNLNDFQRFLQLLASRAGQLLNLSELSRSLGVAVNTVKSWIGVLEASHQVHLLKPYFRNMGKRLVKAPKVYFLDTGLLCYLTGLREPEHAMQGPMAGALFENAVFAEIFKSFIHRGERPLLYFWRTSAGHEVDFVLEREGKLLPIETKLTETPRLLHAEGISKFRVLFGPQSDPGILVTPSHTRRPLNKDCEIIPLGLLN